MAPGNTEVAPGRPRRALRRRPQHHPTEAQRRGLSEWVRAEVGSVDPIGGNIVRVVVAAGDQTMEIQMERRDRGWLIDSLPE